MSFSAISDSGLIRQQVVKYGDAVLLEYSLPTVFSYCHYGLLYGYGQLDES